MQSLFRNVASFFLLFVSAAGTASAEPGNSDDVTRQNLISAWTQRQESVRTLNIKCSGIGIHAKGSTSTRSEFNPDQTLDIPSEDFSYPYAIHLVLDLNNRRYFEWKEKIWSSEYNKYFEQHAIVVQHDGRRYAYAPRGESPFPTLQISDNLKFNYAERLDLKPIGMMYYPFQASFFPAESISVSANVPVFQDRQCIEVVVRQFEPKAAIVETLWVDPTRQFLPLRYYKSRDGKPQVLVENQYQANDNKWELSGWTLMYYDRNSGLLKQSWNVTVDQLSINEPIQPDTYTVNPMPGTVVHNRLTDEQYLIKDEDTRREILPGEFEGTSYQELTENYQELTETNSGDLLPPGLKPASSSKTFVIGGCLLFALGVLYFVYRRKKRL